jgi:chromatin remodeling complex protein RSC6
MVRTAKTEKPSAPVSAPASVPAATDSTAAAPAKKEKKAKKVVEAVETPAAAPVEPTNEVVVDVDASSLAAKMTEFNAKLQQLNSIFSAVKGDFKTLEKIVNRELKAAQKSSGKKTKRTGNRAPSGFVKPTLISDELAVFLGKAAGTEMARTAVSKEINNYIRTNQLQDKTNGRIIVPDSKLATLLKTQPSDQLTYFNLQRFMKHHFVKAEAPATA